MAKAEVGKVIFSRDDEETDIWDDSALIKAYDKAMAKAKGEAYEENEVNEVNEDEADKNKSKHKYKRHKQKKSKTRHWRVGDICRVVYSGDEQVYTATITALDETNQTCRVLYIDYNEEEEHNISALKHVKMRKHASVSESGSVASDIPATTYPSHQTSTTGHQTTGTRHSHMPPPPPPPHHGDGGKAPPFPFLHPPWTTGKTTPSVPFIPPPPPPMLGDEQTDEDSEAMCSMLMAWYMSGYHTGYYQGLREGKKLAGSTHSPYR